MLATHVHETRTTRDFLGRLTDEGRAALLSRGERAFLPRGSTLLGEGDEEDSVLVVLSGLVKVSARNSSGRQTLLSVRGPGDLLGEVGFLDGGPRSASAFAIGDVHALQVAGGTFRAFLDDDPAARRAVLETLIQRLRSADRQRLEMAAYDTPARVAARLVELSREYGETHDGNVRIDLSLSQEELAAWTGASQSAFCTVLLRLRREGLIDTAPRSITVLDLDGLTAQAGAG